MPEFFNESFPNVVTKLPEFYKCILQTLEMVAKAGSISFVLGLFLGTVITVTKNGGVMQNTVVYQVLDKLINFFRSIPFIILLAALIPLTRAMVGTAIGVEGAIVPLVFGTVPFFSRQIESALAEIDPGLVEAAQSMGSSPLGIVFRIYLRESIAAIARVTTITAISLVGLTAMAGAVGAGGLGDFAIRYGHQRNQIDVTYITVLVLVLFISIIQAVGTLVAKKSTH